MVVTLVGLLLFGPAIALAIFADHLSSRRIRIAAVVLAMGIGVATDWLLLKPTLLSGIAITVGQFLCILCSLSAVNPKFIRRWAQVSIAILACLTLFFGFYILSR